MGVRFPGKKRYEGVRFNVICPGKKRYVTLEWPLSKRCTSYVYMYYELNGWHA